MSVNWEKLAVDEEFRGMWESPEMLKQLHALEDRLRRYSPGSTLKGIIHAQGVLEGLAIARAFPERQRNIERQQSVEEVVEGTRFQEGYARLKAFRFGGV